METIRKCIIHIVRINFDTSFEMLRNNYMQLCYAVKNVAKVKLSKIKPENDWNNRLIKVEYF